MKKLESETDFRMEPVALPLWREAFGGLDWLALRLSGVYAGAGVLRGDGEPVVVVPGCFASDSSVRELHRWLRRIGYKPYFSGIGRNLRCPERSVDLLVQTVDRAFRQTGKKVTIIGHSLGGLLARGAALRDPQKVARVITLGSPVSGLRAHGLVLAAATLLRGQCDYRCLPRLQRPLPASVKETSIFTRGDGVVDWRTCFRKDSRGVEVAGTHVGLTTNSRVYAVIAEVLAGSRECVTEGRSRKLRIVPGRGAPTGTALPARAA
jgi:pimeloyl-ACP methyl ester carboxylesterase